jgi:hypothetical protein
MKSLAAVGLACVLTGVGLAAEISQYPNEVDGYKFYSSASWRTLVPLKSTMADVRKVLGNPSHASDIADFMKPYPGDERVVQPVWTYGLNDRWEIIVYFVKSSVLTQRLFNESLYNTLYSIEYVPRKPHHFDLSKLPSAFRRSGIIAADAAWDEYSDGSGLVYEVYTSMTPYGGNSPGDLNRVVYGPPKASIPNEQDKNNAAPTPSGDVLKAASEK